MKHEQISAQENVWIDKTSEVCAQVAVGCAEAAEVLKDTRAAADDMRGESNKLAATIQKLGVDTSHIASATKQARALSNKAKEMLDSGEHTISMSTQAFADIIKLIAELGEQVTGFAGAMDQVRNASQAIDGIARTTNMLALNASIEAAKAGEAGRSFAVVADEVKKLAYNSRSAAVEIMTTISSLSDEAGKFIERIEQGKNDSDRAKTTFDGLQKLLTNVSDAVTEIGEFNEGIAGNGEALHNNLIDATQIHQKFDRSVEGAHGGFSKALQEVLELETNTNRMFDYLVHSGLSKLDQKYVAKGLTHAAELIALTEAAMDSGEITADAIFDSHLTLIQGSNPPRYSSRLTSWADKKWRPYLDEIFTSDEAILTSSCGDMQGFLPTHMSHFSQNSTGDLAHDTANCRNGRVLFEGIDFEAKKSDADYMMGVYCQEGDGKSKLTVRNIYVPLRFKGRRWGDLEIAYRV